MSVDGPELAMPKPSVLLSTAHSLDSVITESPSGDDSLMPVLQRGRTEPEPEYDEKAVDEMYILDESDEDALAEDDDEKIDDGDLDPAQTERALATAMASMVATAMDPKALFGELRSICIRLKDDAALPFSVPFSSPILQQNANVESWLKLLGFRKDKQNSEWRCSADDRTAKRFLNFSLLECAKCAQLAQKHATTVGLVHAQRNTAETDTETDAETDTDSLQLYELIWSITHHQNQDADAMDVLLMCFSLVTDAKHLWMCCEARFFNDDHNGRITLSGSHESAMSTSSGQSKSGHIAMPSTENISSPKHGVDTSRILSSFAVQLRVVSFVQRWMREHWATDWATDAKLIARCQAFTKAARAAYTNDVELDAAERKKGLKLLIMLQRTLLCQQRKYEDENAGVESGRRRTTVTVEYVRSPKHSMRQRPSWKKLTGSRHIRSVTDVDPAKLAEQITQRTFTQYSAIAPRECFVYRDEARKHEAPHLLTHIAEFNRLSRWLQASVLLAEGAKARTHTLKRWLKVERELFELRNFHALAAVHSALTSTPIFCLKTAWQGIKSKHLEHHHDMSVALSHSGNWRNLRRLELETHPPMVPYFGLLGQDLFMIAEAAAGQSFRKRDGSIDWSSLRRMRGAVRKCLALQQTPYANLTADTELQRWMLGEMDLADKLESQFLYDFAKAVRAKDQGERGVRSGKSTPVSPPTRKRRQTSTMSFPWNKSK